MSPAVGHLASLLPPPPPPPVELAHVHQLGSFYLCSSLYLQVVLECVSTISSSGNTVVLQQKCDNATLIIFISTTTTTGTDSDRVTRLTTYCREHAPSLANVVSTTLVRPPGTLCHLTYMTLLTLTHSRNDLKLFCLIVCTDLLLLLYGAPGRFVCICICRVLVYYTYVEISVTS